MRRLDELAAIGRPVLVGLSRKSSLGKLTGSPDATVGTAAASVGAAVSAYERGATILRVHDVREHVEALAAASAVSRMIVELRGLEVFGYHGVEEAEQRLGQLFLFDVRARGGRAWRDDRLDDAVDYTQVATRVRELSIGERFDLLEALATAVADLLIERFRPSACACACASRRSSRPG